MIKSKIVGIVVISAVFLFLCSSLRHAFFHSTARDLGIFDQTVYLISQGQPPISSILNFHILADHAAFIWYPISLLYKLYPSVYWLFAIQAIALALGAYFIYQLALQRGLNYQQTGLVTCAYLLYPTILSVNLFDMHPDVIAVPGFLALVLVTRRVDRSPANLLSVGQFCALLLLILSCKAVFGLTIAMIGFWLLLFEKKRIYGAIAIIAGISWFIIAIQLIIPYFGTQDAAIERHLSRYYGYLGHSLVEIILNIFLKPQLVLMQVFSLPVLKYVFTLILPLFWGLSLKHLSPLLCALPQFMMNVLSADEIPLNLAYHYTLPILLFLLLVVIDTLKSQNQLIKNKLIIAGIIVIGFFISFKPHLILEGNRSALIHGITASRKAVQLVHDLDRVKPNGTKGSVLTTAKIFPHLSHRSRIELATEATVKKAIDPFDYIVLNLRYPTLTSTPEFAQQLAAQIRTNPKYQVIFQEDEIVLFASHSLR